VNGGSASGSLAGAVMTQRPELVGAVVIDRPSLDMVRFHKFTASRNWIQEFGSPENEDEFRVLYALSPYHKLESRVCYPPTLIMVGDRDEVTPPLHSYKFVAKLQNLKSKCNNPAMLKIMRNTGHSFGETPETVVDSRLTELLFVFKSLGIALDTGNTEN
jgi:prolyl oligopeptidase